MPEAFAAPKENIAGIRRLMQEKGLDAYVIPATDPHTSEYLPEHWKTLFWASGFTGSAGTLVVTADFAGLWTDSRYFIQAEQQLSGSGIELVKLIVPHTPEFADWLVRTLPEGATVGVDGHLMSRLWYRAMAEKLAHKSIGIDPFADLAGPLWKNRPPLPDQAVYEHPLRFAAVSRKEKIRQIRERLAAVPADYTVFSSLDDIAWTFNLRGNDVPYNPVFVAHALIGPRQAVLFIDPAKVPDETGKRLRRDGVTILPYAQTTAYLSRLPAKARILIDPKRISQNLPGAFPPDALILEGINISTLLKACKTEGEIRHTRQTMVKDGVALTRFFYWLSQNVGRQTITEISATEKLHELRREQEGNVGESFGTIAAYGPHAALPHYSASPESDVVLRPDGLFLLDSGGQYLGGTTDTTRVISLGNYTEEQQIDYTLVLKGMIALCRLRFPRGTKGWQIDALARAPQWMHGINFGHGTGHGVGYFLNVHEGPQSISPAANPGPMESPLLPGMITSVEPGIYRSGKHGVRLENLVLCVEDETTEFGAFLRFESLTLAPIFTNLVKKSLMNREELQWLRTYNQMVYRKISRYLNPEERAWLKGSIG